MVNLRIICLVVLMLTFLPGMVFAQEAGSSLGTPVVLSIEGERYDAILYDNPAAGDLVGRLPLTLHLGRGGRDYCGDISPLAYEQNQVQAGYKNGQLAYWIPGQDFVIFIEREESSSSVGGVVPLGEMVSDFSPLFGLQRAIQVEISLAPQALQAP